jgi:hypothetical protein
MKCGVFLFTVEVAVAVAEGDRGDLAAARERWRSVSPVRAKSRPMGSCHLEIPAILVFRFQEK